MLMRLVYVILGLSFSAAMAQESVFIGGGALDMRLSQTVFQTQGQSMVVKYLDDNTALFSLMGERVTAGNQSRMENVQPNAVNTMIYHMVLMGLARDLADVCERRQSTSILVRDTPLQQQLQGILFELCTLDFKGDAEALESLWWQVMGYEAPDEERVEWLRFARTHLTSNDVVERKSWIIDLFSALFFHPFYVLEV